MKLPQPHMLAKVFSQFQRFPPLKLTQSLWAEIEPRRYERDVYPVPLIKAFLMAYVLYLPGAEEVARRFEKMVKTRHRSTLSYALRRNRRWTCERPPQTLHRSWERSLPSLKERYSLGAPQCSHR